MIFNGPIKVYKCVYTVNLINRLSNWSSDVHTGTVVPMQIYPLVESNVSILAMVFLRDQSISRWVVVEVVLEEVVIIAA